MTKRKKIAILLIVILSGIIIYFTFVILRVGNEEYEVYSAVLSQMWSDKFPYKIFVIKDRTSSREKFNYHSIKNLLNGYRLIFNPVLIIDYNMKNLIKYKLKNDFSISQKLVLISEQEIEEIFSDKKGWNRFYKKYPHSPGTIEISRVGFNIFRTRAIVYFGNQFHWLGGHGYIILLKKKNGEWIITEKVMVWIS